MSTQSSPRFTSFTNVTPSQATSDINVESTDPQGGLSSRWAERCRAVGRLPPDLQTTGTVEEEKFEYGRRVIIPPGQAIDLLDPAGYENTFVEGEIEIDRPPDRRRQQSSSTLTSQCRSETAGSDGHDIAGMDIGNKRKMEKEFEFVSDQKTMVCRSPNSQRGPSTLASNCWSHEAQVTELQQVTAGKLADAGEQESQGVLC